MTVDHTVICRALAQHRPGLSLPRDMYVDRDCYRSDLDLVWHRDWIFAGHTIEIEKPGDYFTIQIGEYPLIVARDSDGTVVALHNSCRHRGFKLCDQAKGSTKRRFVCPYHQWSYELDGRLASARDMTKSIDRSAWGLKRAHVAVVATHIFVSVAADPPDAAPLKAMVQPYLAPFRLEEAKIAFESRIVEHGNWKLVMENNRECYHCAGSHPELCRTFPDQPTAGGGGEFADQAEIDRLVAACEKLGLPGRFQKAADHQYRIMRMPFLDDARSMTMSGRPAVAKRLGAIPPEPNIGDILLYHYPSTWNHFTADHAISFRLLPLSPTETELVTKWLVHRDAVEGVDYELKTLTEVWMATNAQDTALVERNQAGIASPAYEPGPYSPLHESAVMQFVEWYTGTIGRRLDEGRFRAAAE